MSGKSNKKSFRIWMRSNFKVWIRFWRNCFTFF